MNTHVRQLLRQIKKTFPEHQISIQSSKKHPKLIINGHKLTISSTPRNSHHACLNAIKQVSRLVCQ